MLQYRPKSGKYTYFEVSCFSVGGSERRLKRSSNVTMLVFVVRQELVFARNDGNSFERRNKLCLCDTLRGRLPPQLKGRALRFSNLVPFHPECMKYFVHLLNAIVNAGTTVAPLSLFADLCHHRVYFMCAHLSASITPDSIDVRVSLVCFDSLHPGNQGHTVR